MLRTATMYARGTIIPHHMRKYVLLAVLALLTASGHAEISFKANVDKLQGAFEEPFQLTLEVAITDPTIVTTPVPPPDVIGFRIGGSGSSVERQGETIVRKYFYTLKPARSGDVTIPAFKVEFKSAQGADTLTSEPIVVNVDQPKPVSKGSSNFLFYIIGGVVAAGAAVSLLLSRRKKAAPLAQMPDWKDEARVRFIEIKKLADREDFREFCVQGTRFIGGLLERQHEARLTGYTLTDVLRWMEERGLDNELRGRCKELFEFCEEVKFTSGKVDVQRGQVAAANAVKIVEQILK